MRVIAGTAKGRRLRAGKGLALRPTSDKVKGAIFNILASRYDLEGAHVLDLFAGSGNLGIESLSRGAAQVIFVEQSTEAARVLRANLELCRMSGQARILRATVQRALTVLAGEGARFEGVLIDPPYERGLVDKTLTMLAALSLARAGGWVLLEHHVDETPAERYGALRLTQARHYGKTGLAVFRVEGEMAAAQTTHRRPSRAVYAGSFDPITNGHVDVIRRAVHVFDEVIVAVSANTSDPAKDHAFFTADERVTMIRESLADLGDRARADRFSGLLVDYCEQVGAGIIIRGLRAVSDFEYEFQMAMMNRHLKPHIETFFMTASQNYFFTASRLVKEVAGLGGDVRGLLPDNVHQRLLEKLRATR